MTLELEGHTILVDVPQTVCLPYLMTLQLQCVNIFKLKTPFDCFCPHCPVLDDLFIKGHGDIDDNMRAIAVKIPTLKNLTLQICDPPSTKHVIVAPSIKYIKIKDEGDDPSVKHLSVRQLFKGVYMFPCTPFEFAYMGTEEEIDFLSFFFKNGFCLKCIITDRVAQLGI